ncbi:MAG: manganese/iron superoxide dismutase-like protein superoxide dismutase, Fe-Mn family [Candidatus Adlerbacteria bacterium]|nr:manganese/iron superoxide dismutase-like protein superoxide dismutase, Fe-Mn family [Candidatus Adlerbacteria bacterium]
MNYSEKTFDIGPLEGISAKSIEEHLALYAGYVKNFNAISALMPEYAGDLEKNGLALAELIRRRSFEFGGMRLHELYFEQFEGGAQAQSESSALSAALAKDYKAAEHVVPYLKAVATTRGPGWAILYWDPEAKQFLAGFSGEQHQGHFVTLPIILALDVWEHTYILDYGAGGRGKYIDAFFKNLNWSVLEKRFADIQK